VLASALKVEKVVPLTHEISKKLKGRMSLDVIQAQADIKEQLGLLVFKGFVTASGHQRLDDIARYLQAMLRRMEKLPVDPNQDRLKMLEIAKVNDVYLSLVAKQSKGKAIVDEILAVRWMMEEFRVSVFAQNLKTAYPVSAKRILNHLKAISAN
jgi:ATP-dependent helicase HrpA